MSVDIIDSRTTFADIQNVCPSDENSPIIFKLKHFGHKLTEISQGSFRTDKGTFNVIRVKCLTCGVSSNPSTIA